MVLKGAMVVSPVMLLQSFIRELRSKDVGILQISLLKKGKKTAVERELELQREKGVSIETRGVSPSAV